MTVKSPAMPAARRRSAASAWGARRIAMNIFPALFGQSHGGVSCRIFGAIGRKSQLDGTGRGRGQTGLPANFRQKNAGNPWQSCQSPARPGFAAYSLVMAYQDLREFMRALEKNRELVRIPFEVDPRLEITEFADRAGKQGGPALLFERPTGYQVPVLVNAFASTRKMEIALEVNSVEEVARRIVEFLEMRMPEGLIGKLKMLPKLAEMGAFFPKIVSKGPCQEVVRTDGFSLLDYPVLQCWPEDGGRFITLPLVFSRNPDTGKRNCGMYRMQVYDERTAGMHWQTHKQGAEHYRRMQQQGQKRMDVAVAIGADPATMYSAILPLPPDLDEMMISGFLRQSPVEMVKCQTCDLEVPAQAEIVLEGYVELGELRTEGPFGDHTGFYSLADEYPVFHVTCITQRKEPIYATTIVGPPPMEDFYMGKAIERIFLPLMRLQLPEVRDIC